MAPHRDWMIELLPAIHRLRDAEQGGSLAALLRVLQEQFDLVEEDIRQLYDNWFIETCEDWVVPYLGDLLGYRSVAAAGSPSDEGSEEGRRLNRFLAPRREVANTIALRRCKGTLAALEVLANDAAGWPARAVEFYRLLGFSQNGNFLHPMRGRTSDLRGMEALDLIGGAFERSARTVDVRRAGSRRTTGRYNLANVGLFVWRLGSYGVTHSPALCLEGEGEAFYTFSVLGNDAPLFIRPERETDPRRIASEANVPAPLRRRTLAAWPALFYGPGRSFQIWKGGVDDTGPSEANAVPRHAIRVAHLGGWQYEPDPGTVVVDPMLGRIAFPPDEIPEGDVWVTYHYGFSAEMGGGEYPRALSEPTDAKIYVIPQPDGPQTVGEALALWMAERATHPHAVIEIADSRLYQEALQITLQRGESLQIRAASGARPVLSLVDRRPSRADPLVVSGAKGTRFTLDGLVVVGRGLRLGRGLECVTIRHSTLVPGWEIDSDCEPCSPNEPSILTRGFRGRLSIEKSIVGSILVHEDEVRTDPVHILIRDSIVDATSLGRLAIGTPKPGGTAHATLTVTHTSVIGRVHTHAVDMAENSIFMSEVRVARRQIGCMRFCYVPEASRTPRRFHCQPDRVRQAASEDADFEAARVVPQFVSQRYGSPYYMQLSETTAPEILTGADDESEMGAFHDLFQPQREATLRARLQEFIPAETDAAVIHAT